MRHHHHFVALRTLREPEKMFSEFARPLELHSRNIKDDQPPQRHEWRIFSKLRSQLMSPIVTTEHFIIPVAFCGKQRGRKHELQLQLAGGAIR